MKYDVVIIGSGLGGLLCGNILSKEGYSVCLVEKNPKLGGSLQSFGRKASYFNTGLNYTESLDDGQVLNQYFRYFGLIGKIKLKRLDTDGFDIINFNDGAYKLSIGKENFKETLLRHFPGEKDGLTKYLQTIEKICNSIPFYTFLEHQPDFNISNPYSTGAANYVKSVISNHRLQNVLAGNSFLYAGVENKTPLFTMALISNSFIESAWRIVDGSYNLVKVLADNITDNGGTILKNAKVEKLVVDGDEIKHALLQNGEQISAASFISNAHPDSIVEMVDHKKIRSVFATRIKSMEDTIGMFTTYLVFKKDTFPYLNYNFYHYNEDSTWAAGNYDKNKWPQNYVLLCTASSNSDKYAKSASLITYMSYSELDEWKNTYSGKRGEKYNEFKKQKAQRLIQELEKQFPGVSSCIEAFYTSTPLTWRDYTGTRAGSAYGILKDYNRPLESNILPKTKIKNLFLTGQNINIHGILGVTISSVLTCAELIDLKYLMNKIKSA